MKKFKSVLALIMMAALLITPAYARPEDDDASSTRDDEIRQELPDPNDPESPDYVIVDENGTPTGYIKVEDPNNPGQYIYVLEEDLEDPNTPLGEDPGEDLEDPNTPLGEGPDLGDDDTVQSPKTGASDSSVLLMSAVSLSLLGLATLAASKKKVTD